ncbi:hypothetical protein EKD04_025050 [Chloroflexales bacterium ZM16-3]|nr:hypothetical protein [Chloroflexales bacterium ZM16-3]
MATIRVKSRHLVGLARLDAVYLEYLIGTWMPENAPSLANSVILIWW